MRNTIIFRSENRNFDCFEAWSSQGFRVAFLHTLTIVIVIVISKLLKRYSKAKRARAPAYSRGLRRIKRRFPKGGQEKLRSDFQNTRPVASACAAVTSAPAPDVSVPSPKLVP